MTTRNDNQAEAPEQWRSIPGREGRYSVSSWGRVRSEPRIVPHGLTQTYTVKGQILKTTPSKNGYHQFSDGYQNGILVHSVVALAFIGVRPPGMETRHLDDDKNNNHHSNLCYGTVSQNQQDARRNGRPRAAYKSKGSQHHGAKLTDAAVLAVRASARPHIELARVYGVTATTIYDIRRRRSWRHI